MDESRVSIELEPFDLRHLLTDAFDEQSPHARKAGLHLNALIGEDFCIVVGDRMRILKIVDNLLSNAIKFTPAGGEVELGLSTENESAVVHVRDTGMGFESELAEELFEPFNVPDVILCDLGLPGGMDGFAVARTRRAEASLRDLRLVAASGFC